MDSKELDKITSSIKEKIGEENNSIISDDIASLYTFNKSTNDTIEKLTNELKDAKTRNEMLVNANSKLLQQIPAIKDEGNRPRDKEEKPLESFNFMDAFDEKGRFKQKL